MSLEDLLRRDRLRRHRSSPDEIAGLLAAADRGMADARVEGVSLDGRFTTAYGAALSLATAVLAADGFRSSGLGHHATVWAALPFVMGEGYQEVADYLDGCRRKRNLLSYERVGLATEAEVEELVRLVERLREEVRAWLQMHYPELLGEDES